MDNQTIKPDRALVSISQDALGVAPLAKSIASSIVATNADHGLVMGLYGAWGSGKSTFINFVKQAIHEDNEESRPIILDFNPWLFSSHEDLIQRFLIELSQTLSPKTHKLNKLRRNFAGGVQELASVSQELLVFASSLQGIPLVADSVRALDKLSKKAVKQLSDQRPLAEQKAKIEALLQNSNRKILVIIDDIDRLESQEILDIFRMVKSVADFPNIIYLLSFDKRLISNIVKDFQSADGLDYLEKIVQFEIDLPYPTQTGMVRLFGEQIDPAIDASGGKSWDKNRWSKLYRDYLREKLRTPRQAVRLSNAFNITYPSLRGEVDPVDFLAIEALRMFNPDIFYEVKRNADKFIELGQDQLNHEEKDRSYYEHLISTISNDQEKNVLRAALGLLFPRFENAFTNYKSSTAQISSWRAQARVCSSNHIGRYFSYSIQPSEFTDAEVHETIATSPDFNTFEETLIGYSKQIFDGGMSRVPEFLERMLDVVKDGQADDYLSPIIRNLVVIGDLILREEDEDRSGFARIEPDLRVFWVILAAIERLPEDTELYKTLNTAFSESKSIHIPIKLLFYLGREHGLYGKKEKESLRYGQDPYLSLDEVKNLEAIVINKIFEKAEDNALLNNINLPSILYRWRDILDSFEEPSKWARKATSTDEGMKSFVFKFASVTVISTMNETTEEIRVRAENIADFIDLDTAAIRVKSYLETSDLNEKERIIFNAFIKSYDNNKTGSSDDW